MVPADTNGRVDVYAYADGQAELISAGQGASDNFISDVTPSGHDIFFVTRDQLVPQDQDALADVYDARTGGGFPSTGAGVAPPCAAEDCHGLPTAPPALPSAGTAVAVGGGNAVVPVPVPAAKAPAARVKVTVRSVRGPALALQANVSGAGTIRAGGSSTKVAKRAVARAGSYAVSVALTSKARASLTRHRTLRTRIRVTFTPKAGKSASALVTVTVKRPAHAASPTAGTR
jgi:hypothetical protein